ncbi:MAG: HAD family hydrolase [Myxococcota bacterium]
MTRPTVVLYDIDGTLITTGGSGRRAMLRALAEVGVDDAAFAFAGMTDRLIVRQALVEGGVDDDEAAISAVIEIYLTLLVEEVDRTPTEDYRVMPGVVSAVEASLERGFAVGLGTGNVEAGARIKLARVDLADRFTFGGFGSDAEDRSELIRIGAERGASALGVPRDSCRVIVVGDTPRDIEAARAIGAEVVAVATGTVPREKLAPHRPDYLFDDLTEVGAIPAIFDAEPN